jgi:hypothetical protein
MAKLKIDGTLALMLEFDVPVTQEKYLMLAFAGHPPSELDGEMLEELRESGVGNIVADNSTTEN